MFADYIHWQYVSGPRWIGQLSLHIQHMLAQAFSVRVMVQTLLAHWHRDRAAYRAGTISGIALAFAWNIISRAIGFLIRSTVLLAWFIIAGVAAMASGLTLIAFLLWPVMVLIGMAAGVALLGQ